MNIDAESVKPSTVPVASSPALLRGAAAPLAVGLPVYNGEPYLADALDSLVAQVDVDFELWIADNCSTDGTEELCRSLEKRDERVHYLRRERNVGVTQNHNLLVHEVNSPLFLWAASDDCHEPTRLSRLVGAIGERPDAVLSFSAAKQIDERGAIIGAWHNPCRVGDADPLVRFGELLGKVHENYHCFGVFRRDVLLQSNLLPPVKSNDRILVAELALRGPFVEVDEELLIHRLHDLRLTQSVSAREWYLTQRTDHRTLVMPDVEEGVWYLRGIRNSPISATQKLRAVLAMRPWFRANGVKMARNVARAAIDGVKHIVGPR